MYSKRTAAFLDSGVSICASVHVFPPSTLMSTRVMRPRPVHAKPVMGHHPGPFSRSGYAGEVMIDFASISKLNWRTLSPGSGSVYFDVSQRVMNGSAPTLMRRSHFTFVLPSH